MEDSNTQKWWGEYHLAVGDLFFLTIGPLHLAVRREIKEWQVFHEQDPLWKENNGGPPSSARPAIPTEIKDAKGRWVFGKTEDSFKLMPVLADRPVVSRPLVPLVIPSGQAVTIYVSTPLFVRLQIGLPPNIMTEVMIQRPSDTWFGPSTLNGELCYASRTSAYLQVESIPQRPYRAITAVSIINEAPMSLPIERLKLPVPYLSLFEAEGGLWTQSVSMIHKNGAGHDTFDVAESHPPHLSEVRLIAPPRQKPDRKLISHTLSFLFG